MTGKTHWISEIRTNLDPSQSGACEDGDQPFKGKDYGPSRENNIDPTERTVDGGDSACVDNSARAMTQKGLLQDHARAPTRPGADASTLVPLF